MAATEPQPKITLHWLEASRSHRVVWLFEELKVPYELKVWKRMENKGADPKLKEVHPLGKSPVVTIEMPGQATPITLIESANIFEYFLDHYSNELVPKRYQDGKEGQIGGETEQWLRYRTFMHYAEGTIMPYMVWSLVMKVTREAPVPFFIKPFVRGVADKINESFLQPNFNTNYAWLESQLATSPDGGLFLCGKDLTAADILMSFPLQGGKSRSGLSEKDSPLVWAYVNRLEQQEGYKKSTAKVEALGDFKQTL